MEWKSIFDHLWLYLLLCWKCHKHSVGETGNTLGTKLYAHQHHTKRGPKTNTTLLRHFQKHGLHNHNSQCFGEQHEYLREFYFFKIMFVSKILIVYEELQYYYYFFLYVLCFYPITKRFLNKCYLWFLYGFGKCFLLYGLLNG